MYSIPSDGWLPYNRRISMVEAYWDLAENSIRNGYVGYFVNFMFNQLPGPAGHFKFLRVWSVKFLHPARQDMMIVSLTLFPGQGLQRPL